jgi:hypothetical protein
MMNKIFFWLLWLGFVGYAAILAPPDRPETLQLIIDLSTGKWAGINPLVIALFNLMGILPMVYAALILIDGKTQRIPAGLFVAASFAVGAFAILPYLALREPNSRSIDAEERSGMMKFVDSRWLGILLSIGTIVLLVYGISRGNWDDFIQQWQTSKFIHVMSLDFCLSILLLPILIRDDIGRRNFANPGTIQLLSLVPLFGGLIYLCIRPSLIDSRSSSTPTLV